jgi:hypothetical protein
MQRQTTTLFDNLVGECQQGGRHGNAERFGGLEIDNEGKLARLDREIAGLRAIQDFRGIDARMTHTVDRVGRTGHQKPGASPIRIWTDAGLSRRRDETHDARQTRGQGC